MNKIIKSLALILIVYILISLSLFIFNDWDLKSSILFVNSTGYYGWLLLILFILATFVSVMISNKNTQKSDLLGYFLLPFIYLVLFIILFMVFESSCFNSTMGCGLDILVAIGFGILQSILLIINYKISRTR